MTQPIDPTAGRRQLTIPMPEEKTPGKAQQAATGKVADRVSLGSSEDSGKVYGPGLKVGESYELLRQLVIKTLMDQGAATQVDVGGSILELSTLTPEEAQALIAEDGYFGVDQTSQRIVDFAIGAFGSDPAKLEQMKDAIGKGFVEAQAAFGGSLPEISQQTYNAIMEKLDAFAAQFKAIE